MNETIDPTPPKITSTITTEPLPIAQTRGYTNDAPAIRLLAKKASARSDHDDQPLNEERHQNVSSSGSWDFYNSAQWTADGTSILVGSSAHTVSTFVLPDDLLESVETRAIEPQSVTKLPEPTQTIVGAPYFSLTEPASQTFLVGCRDHPIQLYHAFPNEGHTAPLCNYKLIRRETEEYITPSSLIWQYPGTHFICGSTNRLDYFDINRPGSDGPVLTVPTIPSKRQGAGMGMKGTVSALAASPPDSNGGSLIAAGTWTRWLGLYDLYRTDQAVSNWTVSNKVGMDDYADVGGQGIVQVLWSPCGRYLIVNERQSEGLMVYDIRGTGQLLSVLKGRNALTQQKLHCDVFQADNNGRPSFEVWAGTQDGTVVVWENADTHEGTVEPSWDWKAHESPVGSTIVHSSGSVAATCSGGWAPPSAQDIDQKFGTTGRVSSSQSVFYESSVKIWSIGAPERADED